MVEYKQTRQDVIAWKDIKDNEVTTGAIIKGQERTNPDGTKTNEWDELLAKEAVNEVIIEWQPSDHFLYLEKERAKRIIDEQRDRHIHGGVSYMGYDFQTRQRDIIDLMGLIQLGQAAQMMGENFTATWLTKNNATVTMTLEELIGLGMATGTLKRTYVYMARQFKDAMLELQTIEGVLQFVENLDWTIPNESNTTR